MLNEKATVSGGTFPPSAVSAQAVNRSCWDSAMSHWWLTDFEFRGAPAQ